MSVAFDRPHVPAPDLDALLTSLADDPEIKSWRVDVDREDGLLVTRVTLRLHDSAEDEPSVCISLVDGEGERSCSVAFTPEDEPHGAVFRACSSSPASSSWAERRRPGTHDPQHHDHPNAVPLMAVAKMDASDDHG